MSQIIMEGLAPSENSMWIVFLVLGIVSVVLYLFKLSSKESTNEQIKESEQLGKREDTTSTLNNAQDIELIAVITASIAATLGTTSDKVVVRSISRVQNWNSVSRREQQRNII